MSAYSDLILADGPVAYWPMDDEAALTLTQDWQAPDGTEPDQDRWTIYRSGTGFLHSVLNNRLRMGVGNTSAASFGFVMLRSNNQLTGDFDVQVEWSAPVVSGSGSRYHPVVFMSGQDGSGVIRECYIGALTGLGNAKRWEWWTGVGSGVDAARSLDSGALRIARSGTTITFYTREGTGAWLARATNSSWDAFSMQIDIRAQVANNGQGVTQFDLGNVTVASSGIERRIAKVMGSIEPSLGVGFLSNVIVGAPGLVDGQKAMRFDRANGAKISCGSAAWLDNLFAGGARTIEGWFKKTSAVGDGAASGRLITKDSGDIAGFKGWGVAISQSEINFYQRFADSSIGTWSTTGGSLNNDQTYHAVIIFNGSSAENDATIWLNGVEQQIAKLSAPNVGQAVGDDGSARMTIGSIDDTYHDDRLFDGVISAVALYDRALTPSEILEHYTVGTTEPTPENSPVSGQPTITGTPTVGQTLTAVTSGITDADGLGAFSYQWLAGGTAISGATASTYTLTQAQIGANITVTVSFTDGAGNAESTTSAAVGPVAAAPDPEPSTGRVYRVESTIAETEYEWILLVKPDGD